MLPYSNSKMTVELRDIIESGVKLWDFDYDSFYQESEKTDFEQKVIDHYYMRQIGFETVGAFLHHFRARVRELMPMYKQLYNSVKIMEGVTDPFGNVDIIETYSETSTGTSSGTSSGTNTSSRTGGGNNTRRFSSTPQGIIENLDNYLTEASKDENTLTENGTDTASAETAGSSSGSVEHTLTRKGNQGVNTYAHDIIEFRQSFINIDAQFIAELADLFLQIY